MTYSNDRQDHRLMHAKDRRATAYATTERIPLTTGTATKGHTAGLLTPRATLAAIPDGRLAHGTQHCGTST